MPLRVLRRFVPLLCLSACPVLFAHPGEHVHGFEAGLAHPVAGLDHLLAMVAVGLFAIQLGGRARWALPLLFVAAMACGGVLGFRGAALPGVETGILASVLLLGVFLALAVKLSLKSALPVVAVFAAFHGHAHGMELPEGASGAAYSLGFLLSTAVLHGAGMLIAVGLQRLRADTLRWAGGAIALGAVVLMAGRF